MGDKVELADEGCISFTGLRGVVRRHTKVSVRYETLNRKKRTDTLEGILAQVVQHEVDHLNGILYFMRLRSSNELVQT